MTRLIMLEPEAPGEVWQPFAGARPIAELRAGAWRIRDRWSAMLGVDDVTIMGDHCADFVDVGAAPVVPKGPVQGPAVIARSDFAPAGSRPELDPASSDRLSTRPPASVAIDTALSAAAVVLGAVIVIDAVLTMSRSESAGGGDSLTADPWPAGGAAGAVP